MLKKMEAISAIKTLEKLQNIEKSKCLMGQKIKNVGN
jgi:hypothetical protein